MACAHSLITTPLFYIYFSPLIRHQSRLILLSLSMLFLLRSEYIGIPTLDLYTLQNIAKGPIVDVHFLLDIGPYWALTTYLLIIQDPVAALSLEGRNTFPQVFLTYCKQS